MTGSTGYHAGLCAEQAVARRYGAIGCTIRAERFRGSAGEIDLIADDGKNVIFIEVKKSKTHAAAAARLTPRQINRIMGTASEFLAGEPFGQDTNARFDVALVDAQGRIEVLENALAA